MITAQPTSIERSIPRILYGTAWKEDATARLTRMALEAGFRGIDTANQRKHYHEAGVGEAIAAAFDAGIVTRDELFLQTKFTFQRGQDHRLPYDPRAPIGEQVAQSFQSSLEHLDVAAIDSLILHGPSQGFGLIDDDWAAWRAMERIYDSGQVRFLGISNVSDAQLDALCAGARVMPRFVQNRCYASQGWDRDVRAVCARHGLTYQGFSLLTANRDDLRRPELLALARRHGRTVAQVVFRFAIDRGMIALTGTTSLEHMRADLDILDLSLSDEERTLIEHLGLA